MKRVLAIWLPNWPVQRVVQNRPELAGRAVVLHAPSQRGECVVACSAAAQGADVEPGMPVAETVVLLAKLMHLFESSGPLSLVERAGERGEAGTRFETSACTHVLPLSPRPSPPGRGEQRSHFETHDPAADRAALVALAQWCHRFSPCVGLEEGDAPETLLLDATNLAPLYGGEAALVDQVARALRRRGLDARLALADTIAVALGLVRYGEHPLDSHETLSNALRTGRLSDQPALLSDDPRPKDLADLPLPALRLPDELLETLAHLGLDVRRRGPRPAARAAPLALAHLGLACVGEVLALPREQLRSRFGPLLLARINQFTAAAPEVIVAVDPPEEFAVGEAFEYPLTHSDAIRIVVERLLERLAWLLASRPAGAMAVACRVDCEGSPSAEFEFGLFQPTARARHLLDIADMQLERLRLRGPAAAIEIRVLRHAPLEERQVTLFDHQRTLGQSRPLAALVDRLAGRLGPAAVVRCRLVRDAQPELAYREDSLVGTSGRSAGGAKKTITARPRKNRTRSKKTGAARGESSTRGEQPRGVLDRPLCLLARPAAIEMASVVPEGQPIYFRHRGRRYEIARHWGPERIETGWWRRERAVRDYYRVETAEGRRFWLYRRGDGRWFLHAGFE